MIAILSNLFQFGALDRDSWVFKFKTTHKQKPSCQVSDLKDQFNQSFRKYSSLKTCSIKKPANWFAMQTIWMVFV